jgi:hypothetical protein
MEDFAEAWDDDEDAANVDRMMREPAARAPAAPVAVDADPELPPLPEPRTLSRGDEDGALQLGYTADQMRNYARDAIRAVGAGSREPLTAVQILMDGLMMCPTAMLKDCTKAFEAGARFAERAHGIAARGKA